MNVLRMSGIGTLSLAIIIITNHSVAASVAYMHVDTLTYSVHDCYPQMVLASHEDLYTVAKMGSVCLIQSIKFVSK
jgi:hypothetical protein